MNKISDKVLNKIYFLIGGFLLVLLTISLDINILGAFTLIGFILYFMSSAPRLIEQNKRQTYLVLTLLFVLFIFISKKIMEYEISVSFIPIAGLVMLVTILYNDSGLTFIICLLSSIFAGIIAGGSFSLTLIFLITGVTVGATVWNLRKRIRIFHAGLYAGIIQMLLFMLIYHANLRDASSNLLNGIICGIVVTGILPFLENFFGIITNISLLELSDFNHPLLKKLNLEAPGTYHHSVIVGNLSEAAAESVGANALLARIGAYYHDIGKLIHSEYFVENQIESSKHSRLTPSISKMVIMNHVKEGIELAKKHRLKPSIVDFITRHHGTSLVYYFYRKALEEIEEKEQIQEEGFRYMGPKPNTKETAIVLLADSVEAASRVLNDPQPAKIKEIVHKIINNKFIDGQLDDCDLTLKDLEKIANIFIHMLSGIYHGRINYPEGTKKQNNHKKNNQQTSTNQPGQDKEAHPKDS